MKQHPGTFTAGLIFVLIGITYLLDALEVWKVNLGRTWPIALIAAGIVVILNARHGHTAEQSVEPPTGDRPPTA